MSRLRVALSGSAGRSQPHKGLYLEKHLPPKTGSIRTIAPDLDALCRLPSSFPAYTLAYSRWEKHWQDQASSERAVVRKFTIRGRLATGLGQSSVHEISCRFHHTYGVPWIPGSGIRGALRHRLEKVADGEVVADPAQGLLFGSTDEAGFLTVHDAWWAPQPNQSGLALDVLTPHHSEYYTGDKAPTDFDSPTPVSFLSFTGTFLFVLEAPNASWRDYAGKLLDDVLQNSGLGAKRSSGYGRFKGG